MCKRITFGVHDPVDRFSKRVAAVLNCDVGRTNQTLKGSYVVTTCFYFQLRAM